MNKLLESGLAVSVTCLTLCMFTSVIAPSVSLNISLIVVLLYVLSTVLFKRKGSYVVFGLYTLSVVLYFKPFLIDTYYFLNEISTVVANQRFVFLKSFDATSKYEGGLFISAFALLLCAYVWRAVKQKNHLCLIVLIIITLIVQMLFKTSAPILISVSFFMFVFITFLYMKNSLQHKSFIYITTTMASLFVLATGLLQAANVTGESLQQAVQTNINDWRFNGDPKRLPDGQLQYATKFSKSDELALKVVMEKPTPVYLKGYIGTQFQGNKWQRLEGKQYLQSMPLLNALHKRGFTSYNQFALAANVLQESTPSYKMSVQNMNADRRYGYTPYEAVTVDDSLTHLDGIGVTSKNWRGASSYELTYSPTAIQQYPKVAGSLYTQTDSEYLNMESYYNEFVYSNYLHIENNERAVLMNHFTVNEQTLSYEKAIELVQAFLKENIQYEEKTVSMTSIQQLLEETKKGYAPHYATVATLLFRSMQIPARYVEGYIVTKQDVKGLEAYSELAIAQKNAHAWTEIYIDTVGWVPIEVTPGYEKKMPDVVLEDYPAFEGAISNYKSEQAAGITQSQKVKDEKITDEKTTPEVVETNTNYGGAIIFLLVLLGVTFLLYKKIKRMRYLQVRDKNVKVIRYWAWLLYMLEREMKVLLSNTQAIHTYTNNESLQYALEQSMRIYEKAKYSGQTVSDEQLKMVKQTVTAIKKDVRKNKKHIYKVWMLLRY